MTPRSIRAGWGVGLLVALGAVSGCGPSGAGAAAGASLSSCPTPDAQGAVIACPGSFHVNRVPITAVRLADGGHTLVMTFNEAPGAGRCSDNLDHATVDETPSAVTVTVYMGVREEPPSPPPGIAEGCASAAGVSVTTAVRLQAPFGTRPLYDGFNGLRMAPSGS